MERVVALLGELRLMVRCRVAAGRSFHDIILPKKHRESRSCVTYVQCIAGGILVFFRHGVSKIYT